MKKVIIFFSICLSVVFSSCFKEVDVFDSETLDYSGRWYFEVKSEDGTVPLHNYGSHMLNIYNTSENVANKIWIDDTKNIFGTLIKYDLKGDPTSFSSTSEDEGAAGQNMNVYPRPATAPEGLGESALISNYFNKGVIIEGKILKLGGSSKTGSETDSLYLKLKFYAGEVAYSSVFDEATKKYDWDSGTFSYYANSDTIVSVGGTLHTGFPEDDY